MNVPVSAIIGLILYVFFFGMIFYRNFISTRLELRDQNIKRVIYESIYDKNNPTFFPALCICILSVATGVMYVAFRRGLIFNILQQACFVIWEVALLIRMFYLLDPFDRVIQQSYLTRGSQILHIILPLFCIANITLYLSGYSTIKGDFTTSNLYFMAIALFLALVSGVATNFFMKIYFSCSRGAQYGNLKSLNF